MLLLCPCSDCLSESCEGLPLLKITAVHRGLIVQPSIEIFDWVSINIITMLVSIFSITEPIPSLNSCIEKMSFQVYDQSKLGLKPLVNVDGKGLCLCQEARVNVKWCMIQRIVDHWYVSRRCIYLVASVLIKLLYFSNSLAKVIQSR